MLELESVVVDDDKIVTRYKASQSFAGPDGQGRTVRQSFSITQQRRHEGFEAQFSLDRCQGGSTEEVLDRMAMWLEQLGKAIRNRGPAAPLVSQYLKPVNQDADERARICRLVVRLWDAGIRDKEAFREVCSAARQNSRWFWEESAAHKSAEHFDFADVIVAIFSPERHDELVSRTSGAMVDEDAAYEAKRAAFYEIASAEFDWI